MQRTPTILVFLALAACGSDSEQTPRAAEKSPSPAVLTNPDLAAAEERLQGLETELESLRDEVSALGSEAAAELQALLTDLDRKREAAAVELSAMGQAGAETWAAARSRVDALLTDFANAIVEARERIQG